MNAAELYDELKRRRVELWCQGKMLRFRAPDNALDAEMMTQLRKFKKQLIEILQNEQLPKSNESRVEAATVGQQALYFLHLSAPYSPAYNVASACRVVAAVDEQSVQTAAELLVQRHESLRTTMEFQSGHLKRRIHQDAKVDFASVDARDMDTATLDQRVKTEYERPFDLETGPLLRVRWFRINENEQVLLVALHHIVFDAWSLWILQDELFQILAQVHGGQIAKLPSPQATYSDFAIHQQDWINSVEGRHDLQYWMSELAGPLPSLDLPTDYRRPARPEYRGATLRFQIPESLTADLRELSKSLRVTPFALTMAIFKVLLHRITGQDDLIVGTTTSGRTKPEFNSVIGYFVNSMAIRSNVDNELTFAEFATNVKAKVLGALKHQSYPFVSIVDKISQAALNSKDQGKVNPGFSSGRRSSGNPVFTVMFGLQKPRLCEAATLMNQTDSQVQISGFPVRPFPMDQQEGQCDLTLEMFDTDKTFVGTLKYDTDLFSPTTAKRIGDQFVHLCGEIARDPNKRLSQYDLVSPQERSELMRLCETDQPPTWDGTLIHQWVEKNANSRPEHTAWVCGDEEQTYAELNAAGDRVAGYLIDRGLRSGDLVGCCHQRGPASAAILLGILKAGCVYVPLNVDAPAVHTHCVMRSCDAKFLFTDQSEVADLATDKGTQVGWLPDLAPVLNGDRDLSSSSLDALAGRTAQATSPAYVLHTSGSTGTPKGVCVSHEAIARHIVSMVSVYEMTSDDRVLQFSNMTFDPSLEQMFSAWAVGACVVARGNELWSPETLWQVIDQHSVTIVNLPPAYFQHCDKQTADDSGLESLRLLILGGDVFPGKSVQAWQSRQVRILNAYGPTEAVITATIHEVDPAGSRGTTPIGRPRPGTRAYLLDNEGRLCPLGTAGYLHLGGSILADGYYRDPDATRARFRNDPFVESGIIYDTGDLARWNADGNLEFLGRVDQQVKLDGIRADTSEVELAINQLDQVAISCVRLNVTENTTSDGGKSADLIAWVQLTDNDPRRSTLAEHADSIEAEILSELRTTLPRYLVPRRVVVLESLPINASGKIAYAKLPMPVLNARSGVHQYVPPRNAWQTALAKIWADELGVSPVGIYDNFFDLGGASLTSLRIIARANDAGLNPRDEPLNPELLFEFQSIADLHQHLGAPELNPAHPSSCPTS
ncbi:non-ribosomal peptide synthetase [Neorhodopirellula pilleata]|uniref:Linear gramicidin synthase subunit D n=1 Tax=Neorhodopirellula pilleata TaxID=2714738 RepID=A0A5C6AYW2_9BACT|nr:non-ribosomal peptide synthetase [Neorhodopirellula pilleata]TWU03334.1 Linear gramicidin synthase subunit D [Neorhodopirellula pilleata]